MSISVAIGENYQKFGVSLNTEATFNDLNQRFSNYEPWNEQSGTQTFIKVRFIYTNKKNTCYY